ncbi:MAG: histidine phosphatase family protein [Propionicimonas sp.]|nr:histidine phosphatase family protein [Propionicimonas sp.]
MSLMANKTLIVLRHAKSSWQTTEADQRRPLSERGERDALAAGEILAGYKLDVVLASTATRVQLTWEGATEAGAECADVRFSESVYQAWPGELLGLIQGLDESDSTAVLIGHQPTLSELILALAKPNELTEKVAKKFPTCGLAVLTFAGTWAELAEGAAELARFEIPRG